jgi:hypothetical protein
LAVKYADLYRRAKIEETIYEMLTKQFELAKVQEAKEVPSVGVVEEPFAAQKRSGPPRVLIIVGLTLFSVLYGILWIVGKIKWESIEPDNEHKLLVLDILSNLRASSVWSGRAAERKLAQEFRNRSRSLDHDN